MATILFLQTLFAYVSVSAASITLVASFNRNGITGNITFSQENSTSTATITINLQGLELDTSYTWRVHQYPSSGQHDPCSYSAAGGCYDPQYVGQQPNYTALCAANQSLCEIGDLTGRHGPLTITRAVSVIEDSCLNLYGVSNIVGRSLVLNWNETQLACTNIGYPTSTPAQTILYASFRVGFVGAVYFRPFTDEAMTAFADLYIANDLMESEEHSWHTYELATNSSDCTQTTEFHTGSEMIVTCDPNMQEICESGDLVGKGSQLEIYNGTLKAFYMDTTSLSLPFLDIYSINRSIVVVGTNETTNVIACASMRVLSQLHAVAQFDTGGMVGTIQFKQASPFESTILTVHLAGPNTIPSGFQIHKLNIADRDCNSAGEPWTPVGMAANGGKHLNGGYNYNFGNVYGPTSIYQTYSDSDISLYGADSVIGHSILVYFANSSLVACANIQHMTTTWVSSVHFNTSEIEGSITFVQPTSDLYAATTIIVDINSYPGITPPGWPSSSIVPLPSVLPTLHHDPLTSSISEWTTQLYDFPSQTSMPPPSLVPSTTGMMKKRDAPKQLPKRQTTQTTAKYSYGWRINGISNGSNPGIFSPYGPSRLACSPSNQFMCAVGDLKGKHGILTSNRAVLTDTNLPLAGLHSIIGSLLCIQIESSGPTVCVAISPVSIVAVPNDIIITIPSNSKSTSPMPSSVMITTPLSSSVMITSSKPSNVVPTSSMASEIDYHLELPTTSVAVNLVTATENMIPLVAGCVGGGLAVTFIITAMCVTILCCCKCCRSTKYVIKHPQKGKVTGTELEIATNKQEPELGVPCYRALHNYKPINEDDLQLRRGDIVTLVQASSSGEWWKGTVEDQSGWFPKICVQYFDTKAEERKRQTVGIITPKSEWKSKINHNFRKACDIKVTTTFGQAGPALSSSSCTKLVTTGPDCRPGSPESMSEVIVNMAALGLPHQEVEALQHTAADHEVMSPGVSSDGLLDGVMHGGHYFETNSSQLSLGKHGMLTISSDTEVAWNGAEETRDGTNSQLYGRNGLFDH